MKGYAKMTEQEKNQIALEFFKDNFSAAETHEGYTTGVLYGELKLKDALSALNSDDSIKLALELGIVNQAWLKQLEEQLKDMDKDYKKAKEKNV